jgi:hypothetical protein
MVPSWAAQKVRCKENRACATFIPYTVVMGLCRNPMSTLRSEPGKLVGGEVDRALHPSELDYSLEPRCVRATEQITPFAVQGSSQCFAQPSPKLHGTMVRFHPAARRRKLRATRRRRRLWAAVAKDVRTSRRQDPGDLGQGKGIARTLVRREVRTIGWWITD